MHQTRREEEDESDSGSPGPQKGLWVQTSNPVECRWNSCQPSANELDLGLSMACQVRCVVVLLSKRKEKGGLRESSGIVKEFDSHRWEHDKESSLV
jgi:hypothetical protein